MVSFLGTLEACPTSETRRKPGFPPTACGRGCSRRWSSARSVWLFRRNRRFRRRSGGTGSDLRRAAADRRGRRRPYPTQWVFRFALWKVDDMVLFAAAAHEDRDCPILLMLGTAGGDGLSTALSDSGMRPPLRNGGNASRIRRRVGWGWGGRRLSRSERRHSRAAMRPPASGRVAFRSAKVRFVGCRFVARPQVPPTNLQSYKQAGQSG